VGVKKLLKAIRAHFDAQPLKWSEVALIAMFVFCALVKMRMGPDYPFEPNPCRGHYATTMEEASRMTCEPN
jgi:hypothetical protein